jgi:hypothetical protein
MTKAEIVFNKYAGVGDYLSYGKDVFKHKLDVYKAGRQLDVPRLQLAKHDIDKFLPSSFIPYTKWFYGSSGMKGSKDPGLKKEWRAAVQKHYKRNPHHANKFGKTKTTSIELESLADWFSASARSSGYRKNFPDFREWVLPRLDSFNISKDAKQIVKDVLL